MGDVIKYLLYICHLIDNTHSPAWFSNSLVIARVLEYMKSVTQSFFFALEEGEPGTRPNTHTHTHTHTHTCSPVTGFDFESSCFKLLLELV